MIQIETFRLCDYKYNFDNYICDINEFLEEQGENIKDIKFYDTENESYHYSTCYITWLSIQSNN